VGCVRSGRRDRVSVEVFKMWWCLALACGLKRGTVLLRGEEAMVDLDGLYSEERRRVGC
jgi:hypothetical protein